MKTTVQSFISSLVVIAVALNCVGGSFLHAFFSDMEKIEGRLTAGNLVVVVDNVSMGDGETASINAGEAALLSFRVRNAGSSVADYAVALELAFEENANESGVLLVYPSSYSVEDIYDSIANGYTGAVIGNVSDSKAVFAFDGEVEGIREQVATGVLEESDSVVYSYNIFFAGGVSSRFRANVVVVADVSGRNTAWAISRTIGFTLLAVDFDSPFVKIVGGNYHVLALTREGRVYAFGRNVDGQLGMGNKLNKTVPTLIPSLENIVDIAACNSSSFALADDGVLYSWGHNGYGHLGNGTYTDSYSPNPIAQGDLRFTKVFARFNTVGAVTADGEAWVWGFGRNGVLGNGEDVDGNPYLTLLEVSNVVELDFGTNFGAALVEDGRLYTWGNNIYGVLGRNVPEEIQLPAPVPFFEGAERLKEIGAGSYHITALSRDGLLYTWGLGQDGRLGTGNTSFQTSPYHVELDGKATSIAAGTANSAVIVDGRVYVFGDNTSGMLGNTDDVLSPMALNIENAKQALLIATTTLVLTNTTVFALGTNNYGTFGNGTTDSSTTPTEWISPL